MHRPHGFTLLELLIVIAIAAVLLTIGVPSFRAIQLNGERGEAATSLYGGLARARSEAIIRNATITVCPRSTVTGNYPQCDLNAASWTHGWIVYQNGSGASGEPNQAADIIAVGDATDTAFAIATVPAGTGYFQFTSAGRALFSNFTTLTMTLCQLNAPTYEGRQIAVDLNGRVSLSVYPSASGKPCPAS